MFNNIRMKKGQVTIFVILAIVILLIVIFLFKTLKSNESESINEEINLPSEIQPISTYVESCMKQVAISGIKEMGLHGGYVDPLNSRLKYNSIKPTESDLVSLTGSSSDLVPYYVQIQGKSSYYNYELTSSAPTIDQMNINLENYVKQELPNCLEDFSSFKEQGFEINSTSGFIVDAIIKENKIDLNLNHKIIINKDSKSYEINKYSTSVNFPLKKIYDFAIQITLAEYFTQFSESFSKSLINYYSGADATLLPPISARTNAPYVITWSKTKVENDFNNLLISYVPALQVSSTKDFTPIQASGDQIQDAFLNSLILNLTNSSSPNSTSVSFIYRDRTASVKINPSKGDLIRPSVEVKSGNSNIPEDRDNIYQFYYDISYPLFVEIRENNQNSDIPEFSYIFAIESNTIENKPALAWELGLGTVEWDSSYISTTLTLPDGTSIDSNENTVDIAPKTTTKSLFCNEETWSSGQIELSTTNNNNPLEGVNVGFGCADYDQCFVGQTQKIDGIANWNGTLPICEGGYLYLFKDGYGSKKIPLSTASGASVYLPSQSLDQVKLITATIKKKTLQKKFLRDNDWSWSENSNEGLSNAEDIGYNDQQVILTMTQVGESVGNQPISNTIIFGKDGVESSPIQIVPGEYELSATLINDNGIIIPANCTRQCSSSVGICLSHIYYPSEAVEIKPATWGGILFTETNGATITISADELKNINNIEFNILELPDLSLSTPKGACLDALNEMNKIEEYSLEYRDLLKPILS